MIVYNHFINIFLKKPLMQIINDIVKTFQQLFQVD